jgi:hypothetical protein
VSITGLNPVTDINSIDSSVFPNKTSANGVPNVAPNNESTLGAFNISPQFPAQNVAYKQFVGAADSSDFYSFTLTQASNVIIRYDGTPDLVGLRLGRDINQNGFLGGSVQNATSDLNGDSIVGNGIDSRDEFEVFPQQLSGNVVYNPLPPFNNAEARFDDTRQAFLTTGPTDIYARLQPGTYYFQVDPQAIQTDLGDGLTRYGSANILYNLTFILEPQISNG